MNVNKASLFVKKGWLYDKCHGGQVNNIKAVNACVRHLGNEKKNEFFFYIPFGLHYLCTVFQERITHCTENSVRTQTWATPQ